MSSWMSIDPMYLATQYTQIDFAPKSALLEAQYTTYNSRLTAIKQLNSSLSSFTSSLSDYQKDDSLLVNSATSSNDSVLGVSCDSSAVAGTYNIFVEQLAQNHQLAMAFDPNEPLPNDGEFNLAVGGENFTIDLSTLPEGATVSDLAQAINNHPENPGVSATLMRSGDQTYLVLSSDESGADNEISLDFVAGTDPAGADFANTLQNVQELTRAQDAIFRFGSEDSIAITSSSNTVDDVIDGVTFELKGTQEAGSAPIKIEIAPDHTTSKENIDEFISAFNSIIDEINNDEYLASDSTARGIKNAMRNAMQGTFEGQTLYSIGIEFDRNGKLKVNSSRLEEALSNDPQQVKNMLVGEDGLMARLESTLEPYSKSFGILSEKEKTLQASIDQVVKKQERLDYSMDITYQRYLAQFTNMQITIAQLESSMGAF